MTDIDLRPPGFTIAAWPGQVRTVTVAGFPAGYLTGKDHEWRISRAERAAVVDTEAAVIDGTSLTADLTVPATGEWVATLFDTTGTLEEPRLTFSLLSDRDASDVQTDVEVTVAVDTGDVEITLDVTLTEGGGSGSGVVESIVEGQGISVDDTDPANPVVAAEVTQAELDAVSAAIGTAVTALVNGAPASGDTLGELHARLAVIEALGSLATDAELIAAVAAILGSADADGDTLGELQALIGLRLLKSQNLADLANVATARTNLSVYSIAAVDALFAALSNTYAPLANPTFTGNVVVPDADAATEALNRQTGDARYAILINTDDDPGRTIYVGSIDPDVDHTPVDGDLWFPPEP